MKQEPRRRGRPKSGVMELKDKIFQSVLKHDSCAQVIEDFEKTGYSRPSIARVLSSLYQEYCPNAPKSKRPYRFLREALKKRGLIS